MSAGLAVSILAIMFSSLASVPVPRRPLKTAILMPFSMLALPSIPTATHILTASVQISRASEFFNLAGVDEELATRYLYLCRNKMFASFDPFTYQLRSFNHMPTLTLMAIFQAGGLGGHPSENGVMSMLFSLLRISLSNLSKRLWKRSGPWKGSFVTQKLWAARGPVRDLPIIVQPGVLLGFQWSST